MCSDGLVATQEARVLGPFGMRSRRESLFIDRAASKIRRCALETERRPSAARVTQRPALPDGAARVEGNGGQVSARAAARWRHHFLVSFLPHWAQYWAWSRLSSWQWKHRRPGLRADVTHSTSRKTATPTPTSRLVRWIANTERTCAKRRASTGFGLRTAFRPPAPDQKKRRAHDQPEIRTPNCYALPHVRYGVLARDAPTLPGVTHAKASPLP